MDNTRNIRRIVHGGQLLLYVLLLVQGVMFRHSHVLGDGVVVSHAHPYEDGGDRSSEQHRHSKTEYLFLDMMSCAPQAVAQVLMEPAPGWSSIIAGFWLDMLSADAIVPRHQNLRGPPSVI